MGLRSGTGEAALLPLAHCFQRCTASPFYGAFSFKNSRTVETSIFGSSKFHCCPIPPLIRFQDSYFLQAHQDPSRSLSTNCVFPLRSRQCLDPSTAMLIGRYANLSFASTPMDQRPSSSHSRSLKDRQRVFWEKTCGKPLHTYSFCDSGWRHPSGDLLLGRGTTLMNNPRTLGMAWLENARVVDACALFQQTYGHSYICLLSTKYKFQPNDIMLLVFTILCVCRVSRHPHEPISTFISFYITFHPLISFAHTSHPLSSFVRTSYPNIIVDRTSHPIISVDNAPLPLAFEASKLIFSVMMSKCRRTSRHATICSDGQELAVARPCAFVGRRLW